MFELRALVDAHRTDIAKLLTAEHGKVLGDALGEVARGLENIEFACGIPHLLKGGFSEQVSGGVDVHSVRQPLGVVAGITPFNFPAMVPMWMFANALACGNTFVLKPSEKVPLTPTRAIACIVPHCQSVAGSKSVFASTSSRSRASPFAYGWLYLNSFQRGSSRCSQCAISRVVLSRRPPGRRMLRSSRPGPS